MGEWITVEEEAILVGWVSGVDDVLSSADRGSFVGETTITTRFYCKRDPSSTYLLSYYVQEDSL